MRFEDEEKFSFDDVLLKPQFSTVKSRSSVDIATEIGKCKLTTPILSSNMDTVTGIKMARKMALLGGLGVIHRYMSVAEQVSIIMEWDANIGPLAVSVGTSRNDKDRIDKTIDAFYRSKLPIDKFMIFVDIAHGDSQNMEDTVHYIRKNKFCGTIVAGSVSTPEGASHVFIAGADVARVGVGAGCFSGGTRVMMGNGQYKDIREIVVGDKVMNMFGVPVEVIGAESKGIKRVLSYKKRGSERRIICTPNHRHWGMTSNDDDFGWVEIFDLNGGKILSIPGLDEHHNTVEIHDVKMQSKKVEVFDIEVDCPTNSFIAEGSIVHNSACTTRVKTGCGYPQLSAVIECARIGPVIADGGIRTPSDAAKCFAAGAKAVMVGGMLAGTDFTPNWNRDCKTTNFRGMSSKHSREDFGKEGKNSEGVSHFVPTMGEGSTEDVIKDIAEGVRSAMSYSDSIDLAQFVEKAIFLRVTTSSVAENAPHILSK